eukprot:s19_g27.t1
MIVTPRQGVVAADISLPVVSRECGEAFKKLQRQLRESAYSFPISSNNSAVFVVNHKSNQGGSNDTGWLIGSSGDLGDPFGRAEESSQAIVRNTARALLERFGAWDASALTVGIGCGLGTAVANPLKDLTSQLRLLGNLEFHGPGSLEQAEASSRIRDISEVQLAFCRLSRGIETFARFVPEPVVKGRKEAVLVYEVMGCDDDEEDEGALEISQINASEAESQRSSPSRRWRGAGAEAAQNGAKEVSFALPPPVVATPDVDTMHDLARRYEMALEAYQGARFEEASDLAKASPASSE